MKRGLIFLSIHFFVVASMSQTKTLPDYISIADLQNLPVGIDSIKTAKYKNLCTKALNGDVASMNSVGVSYIVGWGTQIDDAQAIQWFNKAAQLGYAKAWYNLGMIYKYDRAGKNNYEKAYFCFERASSSNVPLGWYAQGYMLYKGIGCRQNYLLAFQLFRKGAEKNIPSCMYFMGLCFRNGYGVLRNADSAMYWLINAAKKGYGYALKELKTTQPENHIQVNEINNKINGVHKQSFLKSNQFNKYQKIKHSVFADMIPGHYNGYIARYDYSGQFIVEFSPLKLDLYYNESTQQIKGQWAEAGLNSINIIAEAKNSELIFDNIFFGATNHYDPVKQVRFGFEKARLALVGSGDSVLITGNIDIYSFAHQEPDRPAFISLVREPDTEPLVNTKNTDIPETEQKNKENKLLQLEVFKVYPNPFEEYFNIEFNVKERSKIELQIISADGKIVYINNAGILESGDYRIAVNTKLTPGTYIVKLINGNKSRTSVVIKK